MNFKIFIISFFIFLCIACDGESSSNKTMEEKLYGSWVSECIMEESEEILYTQYTATFTESTYTSHHRDYFDQECTNLTDDWGPATLELSVIGYGQSVDSLKVLEINLTSESYELYSIVRIDSESLLWFGSSSESTEGNDGSSELKRHDGLRITRPYMRK